MTGHDLRRLCDDVLELSRQVASGIRAELNQVAQSDVETKDQNSLVSYVDKQAEEQLVAGLKILLPGAGFVTEEDTVAQQREGLRWIIDPLDGTTNFLYKIPHFAVSIALYDGDEALIGVVEEVMSGEQFSAIRQGGAYLNNRPISVSKRADFVEAVIATGFPYRRNVDFEPYMAMLQYVFEHGRGIRRLGSAALDLAYVAAGRFDGYYEAHLNPWDVAAGILIVREAGGKVSDYGGRHGYLDGQQIVAAAPQHHDQLLHAIQTTQNPN